jgi:hypothetical protein
MRTHADRYGANLALIQSKNPTLAAQLDAMPATNVHLLPNATGDMIGAAWDVETQQWVALCDPADPWAEARRDVDQLYTREGAAFALLGFGLGYFAAAFAARLEPHQRLAIFETSPSHFKAAMSCIDMTPIMEDKRVDTQLGDGLDAALEHWFLSLQSQEKFHLAPPLRAGYTAVVGKATYDRLLGKAMDMQRYHAVGLATWRQFGQCIGDNDLGNAPELLMTPGLNELAGAWDGKPAVCLAAGPSLARNVRLLANPALRRKVCVLCVGTVYALVRDLGIEPDLVTTIDFQYLNWGDQFEHQPLDAAQPLLYLHSTHPATVRRWPGPAFVALNSSDTVEWLRQYADPKHSAAQVQTVAHLNVVAAQVLGANPIILLGQDLSMPFDAHHAPGARVQDASPEAHPDSHMAAEDFRGRPCWSRHSFLSMRTVFTQLTKQAPERTYLNCTEGGLAIEGYANAPLAATLETLPDGDGPGLRDLARTCWQGFTAPKARTEALRHDLEAIGAGAIRASTAGRHALLCAEPLEAARAADDAAEVTRISEAILAMEPDFAPHPVTFSLFAVRRFDLVELLAAIPLAADTPPDAVRAAQVDRLLALARILVDEAPVVERLVRQTCRRLADVLPREEAPTARELLGMLARQSFQPVARWLRAHVPTDMQDATPALAVRVAMQVAWHQQEYARVVALGTTWNLAPGLVARARTRLNAAREQHHATLPAYFAPVEPTVSAVDTTIIDSEHRSGVSGPALTA